MQRIPFSEIFIFKGVTELFNYSKESYSKFLGFPFFE